MELSRGVAVVFFSKLRKVQLQEKHHIEHEPVNQKNH